jgi:hypothetical protein
MAGYIVFKVDRLDVVEILDVESVYMCVYCVCVCMYCVCVCVCVCGLIDEVEGHP